MSIRLDGTDARQINEALFKLRKEGMSASGQVLTLVIDTPASASEHALAEARAAGLVHPSRILVAVRGLQNEAGLNAVVDATSTTEVITLEFSGEVDEHADSVLLPLLLPELPVVCWWPSEPPHDLAEDDMRSLTRRLIVDTTAASDPIAAVHELADGHQPGSTDLAWARLTRWRALLVGALDQVRSPVRSAVVSAPSYSSPSELMIAWLEMMLGVPVERVAPISDYPGLHAVELITEAGAVRLRRDSATDATLCLPGQPDRPVALSRRSTQELLGEELSRLTGDETFDALMQHLAARPAHRGQG